jgi:hypothetical protein
VILFSSISPHTNNTFSKNITKSCMMKRQKQVGFITKTNNEGRGYYFFLREEGRVRSGCFLSTVSFLAAGFFVVVVVVVERRWFLGHPSPVKR